MLEDVLRDFPVGIGKLRFAKLNLLNWIHSKISFIYTKILYHKIEEVFDIAQKSNVEEKESISKKSAGGFQKFRKPAEKNKKFLNIYGKCIDCAAKTYYTGRQKTGRVSLKIG